MTDYGKPERERALREWGEREFAKQIAHEAEQRSMEMIVGLFIAAIVVAAIFGVIG